MIRSVEVKSTTTLEDYNGVAHLAGAVQELRAEAATLVPQLQGRSVCMVNSSAQGGGVAEMLPKLVGTLRELGVDAHWLVMGSSDEAFFKLTKRIHNLIHGAGDPELTSQDRALYESVSRANADQLRDRLRPGDILVVHDPQPLGAGAFVKAPADVHRVWRCHIGLDVSLPATRAAWQFLKPYAEAYDQVVFSAPEYIPDYLAGRSSIIHPALDPLSHKNRHLSPHKLSGILCNAGFSKEHAPVLTAAFEHQAQRLQSDGRFAVATVPNEVGLLYRPIVTQISRWDRLKGFLPLLEGFVHMKKTIRERSGKATVRHRRRLEIVRLVLAGPDPDSIQDDPEGVEVLDSLKAAYCALSPEFQEDIALVTLPMQSRKENALMANALQTCSTIVVQNSLREGFGLTVTEAMWKGTAVLGSSACGIRQQVRDRIDGRLTADPECPDEIAMNLDTMLDDEFARDRWGRSAQKRVLSEFLLFNQVARWLRVLCHRSNVSGQSLPS